VKRLFVLVAATLCSSPLYAQTAVLPAATFSYAGDAPLDMQIASTATSPSFDLEEVSFASAAGNARIAASLVVPHKKTGGAVLFVHWLGEDPKTTNRSEFMPDARALAAKGTVSLLIDAPWAQADWFEKIRTPASDYDDSVAEVKNLRRALDALASIRGVDARRIAYVGHDFGAMYGAVLSGVDPRPRYYVLAAGTTTFSEWFLLGAKPADVPAYVAKMAPLDPLPYLASSKAAGYLLQFSNHDAYISSAKEQAFAAAAPAPKSVRYYDADHSLAVTAALNDRVNWLDRHLNAVRTTGTLGRQAGD